jgi:hypothetical protein
MELSMAWMIAQADQHPFEIAAAKRTRARWQGRSTFFLCSTFLLPSAA